MRALYRHSSSLASAWRLLFVGALALSALAPAAAQGQGPQIRLRYATFDPLRSQPQVPADLRMPPIGPDDAARFLMQFQGPVLPEWVAAVRAQGVVIEAYVPDYAFVVRTTLAQAAALPVRFRFVRWTGAFHPAYKLDPTAAQQRDTFTLVATAFTPGEGVALGARLQEFGAGVLDVRGNTVAVTGSARLAVQLARAPEVKWVQVARPRKLFNDRSAAIMGAAGSNGVRTQGLYGAGQIVAVADTGLDTGDPLSMNEDLKGRLVKAIPLGRRPNDAWDDFIAHGTHVAGSVLGNGTNSGSDPGRHDYDASLAGVAPEAGLVFQAIADRYGSLGGIPRNVYDLFVEPYDLGARVHTNSWGASGWGYYWQESAEIDQFVYDNPDMVILFAAANDGSDADRDGVIDLRSISSESAAKNIICVGATEGNRPPSERWGGLSTYTWSQLWPSDYGVAPFTTDYTSDNIEGMAAFSSRGPTIEGRIKPDVVAPGTNIVSVWSRPAALLGDTGWGEFNGAYRDGSPGTKYIYMGGTSMATPLTAGAAALVREYFAKLRPSWDASAALVKAALINGAHDMSPGQYGTGATREMPDRPNNVEGWGRVDLARGLYPRDPRKMFWIDRPLGLVTGGYHRLQYRVKNQSEPLSVTIVWTDPPATPFSYRALVNNLNLKVTRPDGTVIYGNRQPGDTVADAVNNVENVDIAQPALGIYEFRIEAENIPQGPQTYALVVSGGGEPLGGRFPDIVPPQVSFISPTEGQTVSGVVRVEVRAMDNQAVDRVTVAVDGSTRLGSRFGAPYVFYWNTAGHKPGRHDITAQASDFGKNSTTARISIILR